MRFVRKYPTPKCKIIFSWQSGKQPVLAGIAEKIIEIWAAIPGCPYFYHKAILLL